jgi:hypothetical protein
MSSGFVFPDRALHAKTSSPFLSNHPSKVEGRAGNSKGFQESLSQKWEKAFVFFKHEDDAKGPATGPEMAVRFRELADSR